MYYAIQATRWDAGGNLTGLRWQGVDFDGDAIVRHPPQTVTVVDAGVACRSHEVRVYVSGDAGQFFKMRACPQGIEADDEIGTPLRERLSHLPTF